MPRDPFIREKFTRERRNISSASPRRAIGLRSKAGASCNRKIS